MVYSVHPGICVSSCCSLLNFLEHRSHSTSWALSLCEVWALVFLSIPRLHMALHPSRPHCFCVPLALVHSIVVDVFPSESHPSIFSLSHREGVVGAASQTEWMWVFCSQACVQGRPTTPAFSSGSSQQQSLYHPTFASLQ